MRDVAPVGDGLREHDVRDVVDVAAGGGTHQGREGHTGISTVRRTGSVLGRASTGVRGVALPKRDPELGAEREARGLAERDVQHVVFKGIGHLTHELFLLYVLARWTGIS